MGLAGVGLAWHQARHTLGEAATGVALVLGGLALGATLTLVVLMAWRWHKHPQAWVEDLRHPVRHAFVATLPVALLLLATLAQRLDLDNRLVAALWWPGSALQLLATVWVLGRLLRGHHPVAHPTHTWPAVTPVLLVAVVGNALVPLAGVGLGHPGWSVAQAGMGVAFWPVVMALLLVRRVAHGPLPDRLWPTWFICVAPPAVVGLAAMGWGAPSDVGLALWGVALFTLLWVGQHLQQVVSQPFGLAFWALAFPLAAFSNLTLGLASARGSVLLQGVGLLLLAVTSLVTWGLLLATWRGLRDKTLLAPEPVATLTPVSG
jgi:tellurite resistance protein